jgi:hypothetical protein
MTNTQIYSIEGKDSEVVRLIVSLDMTMVNTSNTVVSEYTAFNRAFSAAPVVVGTNSPRASSIANAITTTTGISIYVRGLSDATLANGGTLAVTATLEGRLA